MSDALIWTFRKARRGEMVRTSGKTVHVLTPVGWQKCGPVLRWVLGTDGGALKPEQAERRRQFACCAVGLDAPAVQLGKLRERRWGLATLLNPPLGSGAPRVALNLDAVGGPRDHIMGLLGERRVPAERIAEAAAGMASSRERLKGIEARAQFFLQAGGITSPLVFGTIGVLAGEKSLLAGTAQTVAILAVVVAAIALLITIVQALAAVMRTFAHINPNRAARVQARTAMGPERATRELLALLLLAQQRYSRVADWKLRRLKRATAAFVVTALAISIASAAVVAAAL